MPLKSGLDLPAIRGLVHETPLETRGETGTTTSTETRSLHLVQDPIVALEQDLLGLVPVTALEGTLELVVVESVDVGEDAILILQVAKAGSDGRDGSSRGGSSSGESADCRLCDVSLSATRAGQ